MNTFWRDQPWWLRAVAVAFAAALVMLVQLVFPSAFAAAESVMGDLSWRLGASAEAERRVIIVDIDEASLQKLGPWPWPRETMARLSERLDEAGAAVQAFDMAFDAERPGDAALAAVWARVPVVAGQVFSLDPAVTPHAGVVGGALAAAACPAAAPVSQGYVGNTAALMAAGPAVGHLTPRTEFDGVVRKVPALVCHEGRAYPSLALASLWRAAQGPAAVPGAGAGADWQVQAQRPSLLADLTQPAWALVSPSLPGIWVPLDAQGDMRVPYRSQRSRWLLSPNGFSAIASIPVCFAAPLIGTTAFGMVDVTATPLSAVSSGVEPCAVAGRAARSSGGAPRGAPADHGGSDRSRAVAGAGRPTLAHRPSACPSPACCWPWRPMRVPLRCCCFKTCGAWGAGLVHAAGRHRAGTAEHAHSPGERLGPPDRLCQPVAQG
jgi:adenylate cyclase